MIRLPDTFWAVFNTPLPLRIKKSIPLYPLIHPPGTCWGVCRCALPLRIKNWIPFYSLIRLPGTRGYLYNRYIPGMTLIG